MLSLQHLFNPATGCIIPSNVASAAGLVCLLIFRALADLPYGPIWDWSQYITSVDYRHILLGVPTVRSLAEEVETNGCHVCLNIIMCHSVSR